MDRKRPVPRKFDVDDEFSAIEDFAEFAREGHSDVDGSYTGRPLFDEQPVQDADDL